jgi:hypothetical protein
LNSHQHDWLARLLTNPASKTTDRLTSRGTRKPELASSADRATI